jgi:hypothetical protein
MCTLHPDNIVWWNGLLPRNVKEAGEREKDRREERKERRKEVKTGRYVKKKKNETEGHKRKSRNDPLHFHCSYTYYTTTSTSEISFQKFSCHENLD